MLVAKILGKGQIVIPREIRKKVNLTPGDRVEVKVKRDGILILPLRKSYTETFKGHVRGKLPMEKLEELYEEKP